MVLDQADFDEVQRLEPAIDFLRQHQREVLQFAFAVRDGAARNCKISRAVPPASDDADEQAAGHQQIPGTGMAEQGDKVFEPRAHGQLSVQRPHFALQG